MVNSKSIVYLLLIAILGYFSQGWLFEKGGTIPQYMLILWLIVDIFYMFKSLNKGVLDTFGWLIIGFFIINVFDWFLSDKIVRSYDGWVVSTIGDLKNISVFLLSYFPFKYLVEKNILNEFHIKLFFWAILIVFIFTFFSNEKYLLDIRESEDVTNNYSFNFVLIVPFLAFFFEKKYRFLLVIVMLYFVIMGAKRGAWLCLFMELMLFFVFSFRTYSKKQRRIGIIGIVLGIAALIVLTLFLYNSNDYVQYRFDLMVEGQDSGRKYIWNILLNEFSNSSYLQLLFGRGMDSTIAIGGMYAHNDWYQLLIDAGLAGVTVYAMMFLYLFIFFLKNKIYMANNIKFLYLSSVLCWFLKSFFSMGYISPYSFLHLLPIVYSQCVVNQIKNNQNAIGNNLC